MTTRTARARLRCSTIAVIALASTAPSLLSAQPVVTTVSAWDGSTSASLLSRDFLPSSVGQTFTTPDDAIGLNGFTLFLGNDFISALNEVNLQFHAYLFGWNGTTLADLLWRSPIQSGETAIDLGARSFDVGGVPLTAGSQYAVVLSTLEADPFDEYGWDGSPFAAYQSIGLIDAGVYSGGTLIQSVASDFSSLLSDFAWVAEPDVDLAIELRFAQRTTGVPVPEPSSALLLAPFAVLLLAGVARRRVIRPTVC